MDTKMKKPKTKRVKAWAYLYTGFDPQIDFIEPTKKEIESHRMEGGIVLPCTITYKLPNKKR